MKLFKTDHDAALRACYSDLSTEEEKLFLSRMAGAHASNEDVSKSEYSKLQQLTGGHLTLEGSIYDRKPK